MEVEFVSIGRIAKSFGVKGEVVVDPLSDSETRFEAVDEVYLFSDGQRSTARVESVRPFGKRLLLKFSKFDDRNATEKLSGAYIQIERKDVEPLPEGRYYMFELIGLDVFTEGGECLGKLDGIIPTGENDVYEVHGERGEILLPATKEVIRDVDLKASKIVVRLIPGLLD